METVDFKNGGRRLEVRICAWGILKCGCGGCRASRRSLPSLSLHRFATLPQGYLQDDAQPSGSAIRYRRISSSSGSRNGIIGYRITRNHGLRRLKRNITKTSRRGSTIIWIKDTDRVCFAMPKTPESWRVQSAISIKAAIFCTHG